MKLIGQKCWPNWELQLQQQNKRGIAHDGKDNRQN
jgi:hypothetical protein